MKKKPTSRKKPKSLALPHVNPLNFDDDLAFGDWLHTELMHEYGRKSAPWAIQRVQHAATQLQEDREEESRRRAEILWIREETAFAVPGRYVYISWKLVERLGKEDQIAYVIAHEIAHHDLGHLDLFQRRTMFQNLPGRDILTILLHVGRKLAFSPEHERAADARALDLCLQAGYDGEKCLETFDHLRDILLAAKREEMVYGPDAAREMPDEGVSRWLAKAEVWAWERKRGYPSNQERKAAVEARLNAYRSGSLLIGEEGLSQQASLPLSQGTLQTRLDCIDEALSARRDDLYVMTADLMALTRLPIYRRLTGLDGQPPIPLSGATESTVAPLLEEIPERSRQLGVLMEMLERAEEARYALTWDHPSERDLQILERLLFDEVFPHATPQHASRSSLPPSSKRQIGIHSPWKLLEEMPAVFDAIRNALFDFDSSWRHWAPVLDTFEREVSQLRAQIEFQSTDLSEKFPALVSVLDRLRQQVNTDPLGVDIQMARALKQILESFRIQMEQ